MSELQSFESWRERVSQHFHSTPDPEFPGEPPAPSPVPALMRDLALWLLLSDLPARCLAWSSSDRLPGAPDCLFWAPLDLELLMFPLPISG